MRQLYHLFQILNFMIIAHDFISILFARFWQQTREFILRFFPQSTTINFPIFKDISCCRCAGEGGTGPWGCCSSSRWRYFAVSLYFDDSLYYNDHLSPEKGSSPQNLSSTYQPTLSFLPVSWSVMFCFLFQISVVTQIKGSPIKEVYFTFYLILCMFRLPLP